MTRLEQLTNFLAASPNEPFIIYALAKEYEGLGQDEEALAHYDTLRTAHEDYVGTYYHLGKLLEKSNQIEAAIGIYNDGMRIAKSQNDQHAYNELAGAKLNWVDEDEV